VSLLTSSIVIKTVAHVTENSRYNQGSDHNPCVEVEFSVPGCIATADQAQLAREIKQREDAEWERCEYWMASARHSTDEQIAKASLLF